MHLAAESRSREDDHWPRNERGSDAVSEPLVFLRSIVDQTLSGVSRFLRRLMRAAPPSAARPLASSVIVAGSGTAVTGVQGIVELPVMHSVDPLAMALM